MYGLDAAEEDDGHLALVAPAMQGVSLGLVPGRWAAERLPFLARAPPWVPGSGEQPLFRKWREAAARLKNAPAEKTKAGMVRSVLWPGAGH